MQGRKSVERPKILRITEVRLCLFGSGSSGLGIACPVPARPPISLAAAPRRVEVHAPSQRFALRHAVAEEAGLRGCAKACSLLSSRSTCPARSSPGRRSGFYDRITTRNPWCAIPVGADTAGESTRHRLLGILVGSNETGKGLSSTLNSRHQLRIARPGGLTSPSVIVGKPMPQRCFAH